MKNPVWIVNHHSRDCSAMVKAVEAQGREARVFTDKTDRAPGLPRYLGLATNYLNILSDPVPSGSEWKIVIHDDIAIPDGMFDKMEYVMQFAPVTTLSFYNPTKNLLHNAWKTGHFALRTKTTWWSQCSAHHVRRIAPYVAWARSKVEIGVLGEDSCYLQYLNYSGLWLFYVLPSFTQHLGYDRSIFGIPFKCGTRLRNSDNYQPDFDVTKVDWVRHFAFPFLDNSTEMNREGMK